MVGVWMEPVTATEMMTLFAMGVFLRRLFSTPYPGKLSLVTAGESAISLWTAVPG